MRLIRSRPRFHCDFCHRTATEAAMERHEKICWMNPNRFCPCCKNTGYMEVDYGYPYDHSAPCYYCKKLDESILATKVLGESYFCG